MLQRCTVIFKVFLLLLVLGQLTTSPVFSADMRIDEAAEGHELIKTQITEELVDHQTFQLTIPGYTSTEFTFPEHSLLREQFSNTKPQKPPSHHFLTC